MPACGPWHGYAAGRMAHLHKASKTFARVHASRGGRHKASSGVAWPARLTRSEDIKAGQNLRGSRDVSHDDRHQAGASACSVLVSSLVLRRPAQAKSTEASGKGFLIGATRPRPAGRQDGGHRGAQDGVTTRAFGRRRPPLVRITCTSCIPSNLAVVGSLPAQYLGRGPGPL